MSAVILDHEVPQPYGCAIGRRLVLPAAPPPVETRTIVRTIVRRAICTIINRPISVVWSAMNPTPAAFHWSMRYSHQHRTASQSTLFVLCHGIAGRARIYFATSLVWFTLGNSVPSDAGHSTSVLRDD